MTTGAVTFSDTDNRLALGVDLIDAARAMEPVYPLHVDIEYGIPHLPPMPKSQYRFFQTRGAPPVAMNRHNTGRYSLVYQPSLKEQIDIRIYEEQRRYIPRRLRIPLMTLDDVLALEASVTRDYFSGRVRRPRLFPGAAYHVIGKATGLRGRVLRNGEPMPWVHVEAHADDELVGITRGDDRGEFLLLLNSLAAASGDLSATLDVTVTVFGPLEAPTPATEDLPGQDNLWDLPLETLPDIGLTDDVSPGETPPSGYVAGVSREIAFPIGRMLSGREVDDFIFSAP